MAEPKTPLLDLPIDILLLIFPLLDASSFLNLTSTCRTLHSPDFLHEPTFWSTLVRTTFRVPNQPVVQNDGQRWHKLYKRLRTQSRVMTWGDNQKSCLGHSFMTPAALRTVGPPGARHARAIRQRHISWPRQMQGTEELGVISDLQCGGWSTSLLTSKGQIYAVGVMDGLEFNQRRPPFMQSVQAEPKALRFPPGFVQPCERYAPQTAVRQFSAGRAHVLALSDSGRIWSWQNIQQHGLHVRFIDQNTVEGDLRGNVRGQVRQVVAGWNKSAAYIEGSGIVLWEPLKHNDDESALDDGALVLESAIVPKTGYRDSRDARQRRDNELAGSVGEVLNFIVLENVILFNTTLGKVFAAMIVWSEKRVSEPIELALDDPSADSQAFATDVQGSFRNVAVFTRSGAVLTSNQDRLVDLMQGQPRGDLFKRVPALQNKDVISVAFGDYHFHALHSPGYITSYGNEPQACGALGLGGHGDPEGRLRGIRYTGMGGDGRLVPHAYTEGRRVWFEEEKHRWVKFLTSGGVNAEEAAERVRMAIGSPDLAGQGEVSEWVEQQGRNWEEKFGLQDEDEDGLGAYFALSVTAAGWHSGALVLVNEDLAQKLSRAVEVPDTSKAGASAPAEKEPTEQTPEPPAPAAQPDAPPNNDVSTPSNPTPTPTEPTSTSLLTTALDYGRWFLGVGPYAAPPTPPFNPNEPNARNPQGQPTHGIRLRGNRPPPEPADYGASPREGVMYRWAGDSFPRLVLSDGREMPGEVEFDGWRYGRPEWDLGFEL